MAGTRTTTVRLGGAGRGEGGAAPAGVRGRFGGSRVSVATGIELAPRGVGQILDAAVEIFIARFAVYVGIAALLWLPFQVGFELVARAGDEMAGLLWGGISAIAQILTTAFVCGIAGGVALRREPTLSEALKVALQRCLGVGVIALVTGVTAIVLLCPCLFTTVLAYWLLGVAPAAYMLERETTFSPLARPPETGPDAWFGARWIGRLVDVFRALGRSIHLPKGWPSFGRWFGWTVVANLIALPFRGVPDAMRVPEARLELERLLPMQAGGIELVVVVGGALFLGIATGFLAVVMTVYYLDLRVRKEGLDLERALEALEAQRA